MAAPILYHCGQRSDAWHHLHCGRPTAANFHKILTPTGRASLQRAGYMYRLIAERLMGEHLPTRPQAAVQESKLYWLDRGVEMEPIAAAAFTKNTGMEIVPIGFVASPDGRLGCSPDGLIQGKAESIEIKAPAPWTQIEYLLEGPGNDYRPQVQGQLLIGQFDAVHLWAYHPRMPHVHRVTEPDMRYRATLAQALADFVGELDAKTLEAKELGVFIPIEELVRDAEQAPRGGEYGELEGA